MQIQLGNKVFADEVWTYSISANSEIHCKVCPNYLAHLHNELLRNTSSITHTQVKELVKSHVYMRGKTVFNRSLSEAKMTQFTRTS